LSKRDEHDVADALLATAVGDEAGLRVLVDQVGGQQFGESSCVEAVVLDLRVADSADVHRVGENNLLNMWLQGPGDREGPAGRLEYHSIVRRETLGK
jgi:hypothetical protein